MVAPTYSFNTIASTQTDADSPLDTTLMEAIRQNLIHLEEWLGDGYTAAKDHDHDGVNSAAFNLTGQVAEGDLQSSAVSQAKLKTNTSEVSQAAGGTGSQTFTSGEYGFYPRTKISAGWTGTTTVLSQIGGDTLNTNYQTRIFIDASAGSSGTAYVRSTFVTSSGEVYWLWILREKAGGKILQMQLSPEHPSNGNGGPSKVEHPFVDYRPAMHEVIVVTSERQKDGSYPGPIGEILAARTEELCGLEIFERDYEVIEGSTPDWPLKEVTTGILNADWSTPAPAEVIRERIPVPAVALHRSIRRKTG